MWPFLSAWHCSAVLMARSIDFPFCAAEPSKHESSENDSETKQREEAPRQELKTSRGRMTQNVNYSEGPDKDPSGRAVAVKEEEKADSEADAIKQLSAGGKTFRCGSYTSGSFFVNGHGKAALLTDFSWLIPQAAGLSSCGRGG